LYSVFESGFKKFIANLLMKRITLDKVATLAGVSPATVSRVINNYPHITSEVRERVQQVIVQTGFQPNKLARSLASERSTFIGLVIPSDARLILGDPYVVNLIHGMTQATNRYGLTLSLFLFHSIEEEIRATRSTLNTGMLDGLIITADRKVDSFVPRVATQGPPFILIGRPETDSATSYVDADNFMGGCLATRHLIDLGYQHIAIIVSDHNTAGDDRYAGYRKALHAHGRSLDLNLVAHGDFSLDSGYRAMQELLPHKPDAVFVSSDTMALGAQRAVREAGLRIPDDLAMVGFDDLTPALHAEPQLTTIRQPVELAGATAVELLHKIVTRTIDEPTRIILPVELVIRASCGSRHHHKNL
jgi:LacI family transcriptional regulator